MIQLCFIFVCKFELIVHNLIKTKGWIKKIMSIYDTIKELKLTLVNLTCKKQLIQSHIMN